MMVELAVVVVEVMMVRLTVTGLAGMVVILVMAAMIITRLMPVAYSAVKTTAVLRWF